MLHTKPQGHLPFGSGEEEFWRFFTIYGRGSHLGHVTQTPQTNFHSPIPLKLHMKFDFDWPSSFGEEDLWKWWMDGRQKDGQTDNGAWLYFKLTNESTDSGELTSLAHFTMLRQEYMLPHISVKLLSLRYAMNRSVWPASQCFSSALCSQF